MRVQRGSGGMRRGGEGGGGVELVSKRTGACRTPIGTSPALACGAASRAAPAAANSHSAHPTGTPRSAGGPCGRELRARTLSWPPTSHTVNEMFLYSTVSTLKPAHTRRRAASASARGGFRARGGAAAAAARGGGGGAEHPRRKKQPKKRNKVGLEQARCGEGTARGRRASQCPSHGGTRRGRCAGSPCASAYRPF